MYATQWYVNTKYCLENIICESIDCAHLT